MFDVLSQWFCFSRSGTENCPDLVSCGKIHVNFMVRGSRCAHNTADDAPSGSRTVVPRGGPARWSVSPHRAAAPGAPVCVLCPRLCPPTSQSGRRCGVRPASRLRAGSSVPGVGPASGLSGLEQRPLRVACSFFARGTSGQCPASGWRAACHWGAGGRLAGCAPRGGIARTPHCGVIELPSAAGAATRT